MTTPFYPDLKIVPISDIHLQENVQKSRMRALAKTIEKEGVLRNPPVVTDFFNGTYLHLDGANRLTALEMLGYPNCLVQIVDYSDPHDVHLTSWSHLTKLKKSAILSSLKETDGVEVREKKQFVHAMLLAPNLLAVVVFRDGSVMQIIKKSSFIDQVQTMGAIVRLYDDTEVQRVYSESPWSASSIAIRFERFPSYQSFFAFPTFSPQQVISLVDKGVLMPAGLTRHVVYRRKLNLNIPLPLLKEPVEEANKTLQKLLQGRSVRLYEEPVIYFE